MSEAVRIDKWLWAARFFKTRSLAQTQIERGRVKVNDEAVKASRSVRAGDLVLIDTADLTKTVRVLGLSDVRGSAPIAQTLYEETPESILAREQAAARRRFMNEPAQELKGRPTKRDRRSIDSFVDDNE